MRTFLGTHYSHVLGKEHQWNVRIYYYTRFIREKITELTKHGNWVSQWYLANRVDIGKDAGEWLPFYVGAIIGQEMEPEFKGSFIEMKTKKGMNYYRFREVIE